MAAERGRRPAEVETGVRARVRTLAWCLALALTACSPAASLTPPDDGLDVVATMSVFADFAEHVGGGLVDVTSIVPVGGDPHTYEPTPSDAVQIARADVVLDNGLGLSPWFEPLRDNVEGRLVTLTANVADEARRTAGKIDPHLWMVPDYVDRGYITAIERALAGVDPAHAQDYADNADAYRAELADLDADIAAAVSTIPRERRKLVTSHDAYSYFATRYGITVVGTITGVTTEEEPSARSVSRLIDRIRAERAPAVFFETTINPALAERVARDAGIVLGDPLYGDSVGPPGSGASDYVSMMRANARAIVGGLGGTP